MNKDSSLLPQKDGANEDLSGRVVTLVEEGTETEAFWALLGGKTEYASDKYLAEGAKPPRLYQLTALGKKFRVEELSRYLNLSTILDNNSVGLLT